MPSTQPSLTICFPNTLKHVLPCPDRPIYTGRVGHPLTTTHPLADAHESVLRSVRVMLEAHSGWKVCGEADGREGIEKAQHLKPDVIVLDLAMPVMNGLEAARELTRLLPWVPLLLFTSYETPHLKQEALSAGVRTVMSKSESIGVLVGSIQALLEPVS